LRGERLRRRPDLVSPGPQPTERLGHLPAHRGVGLDAEARHERGAGLGHALAARGRLRDGVGRPAPYAGLRVGQRADQHVEHVCPLQPSEPAHGVTAKLRIRGPRAGAQRRHLGCGAPPRVLGADQLVDRWGLREERRPSGRTVDSPTPIDAARQTAGSTERSGMDRANRFG
jgi:hypothetical protein